MRRGLSLIEVLIALVVLCACLLGFSSIVTGSIRQNRDSGLRTGAVQILNYLGRRVSNGDATVAPNLGYSKSWTNLGSAFPELGASNISNPALYTASILSQTNAWVGGGITLNQYRIEVCWNSNESNTGKVCVNAHTVASQPVAVDPNASSPTAGGN